MDKKQKNIIIVLFTGVLMGALDISIVGPALPSINESLHVDKRLLSWVFTIYIVSNLVGISLLARLSDIFGRKSIYSLSVSIFGVGSVIVAFSNSIEILLLGRAIQGFGASGIFPVASATVGDIFPPEKRGRILGLIGAVFGLAFLIGPVIAGIMIKYLSWHYLFLINIPIVILLLIGSQKFLPSQKMKDKSRLDVMGIILSAVFLVCFSIAVNKLDVEHLGESLKNPFILILFVAAIISLVLFIYFEKRNDYPIVKTQVFKSRQIRIASALAVGTGLYQATFVFIPDMTIIAFDVEEHIASFMLVPVVFATALGSPISGRLIDKYGSRIVIILALGFMTVGFLILQFLEDQKSIYYGSGVLLGLGLSVLAGSSLRYILLNEVPAEERASSQGLITIFVSLGQIMGAAAIGAVIANHPTSMVGYMNAFKVLLILSIIFFINGFFLKNKKSEMESSNR
jgi:EmrB/QacA subfamily drug resistance transporter